MLEGGGCTAFTIIGTSAKESPMQTVTMGRDHTNGRNKHHQMRESLHFDRFASKFSRYVQICCVGWKRERLARSLKEKRMMKEGEDSTPVLTLAHPKKKRERKRD